MSNRATIPIMNPAFGVRRNDRARRTNLPKNLLFQSPPNYNSRHNKKQHRRHANNNAIKKNVVIENNSNDPYYAPTNKAQNDQGFNHYFSRLSLFFKNNLTKIKKTMKSGGGSFNNNKIIDLSIRCIIILTLTTMIISLTNLVKTHLFSYRYNKKDPAYITNEEEILDMLRSKNWIWPISVRSEEEHFETILHPADSTIQLSVPKFFINGPISSKELKLITPKVASSIGTYNTDSDGDRGRFNSNFKKDLSKRTIFISIVSYRDIQCRYTVQNIFQRAKYPDRIRVAVVDQLEFNKDPSCDVPVKSCSGINHQTICNYRDHIDVYELDATLAVGPMMARHIAQRMYRGEYYALQINSHVTFVQDWDVSIIEQWESTKNEMAVISTVLDSNLGSINEETGEATKTSRHILCNSDFTGASQFKILQHQNQPEMHTNAGIKNEIVVPTTLETYWSSSFSFSRGHFFINVPYDPYLPMVFTGEEISIGLRGFTHGYDYYAPGKNIAFDTTITTNDSETKRAYVQKSFWEKNHSYRSLQKKSLMRLLGIIQMNPSIDTVLWNHREEDRYGIGNIRSTATFFQCFGIHVQVKRIEQKLCYFVQSGEMNDLFLRQLRSNGMGIDYSKIHYRFHEKAMKD